jgi:hypothetical protein
MRFARVTIARQTTSLPEPLVKVMPLLVRTEMTGTVCFEVGMIGLQDDECARVVRRFIHWVSLVEGATGILASEPSISRDVGKRISAMSDVFAGRYRGWYTR